jgi:acyl-CoA reductase-like NAD-dependent aldehyde dehydrogenase
MAMIYSYINGKNIETDVIRDIYDVYGNLEDSVCFFNKSLDEYSKDLINASLLWRHTNIGERKEYLIKLKAKFEEESFSELLANTIMREVGKPRCEAQTEVSESIGLIDFFINNVSDDVFIKEVEADPFWETKKNFVKLQPLGIVGIIKPWNYPISNSLWSILPAILAGNVILYKPSEYCCKCAKLLADSIIDTGLPTAVFNVIFGDNVAGEKIVECKYVSMISFTGGSATARVIQQKSAQLGIIRKFSFESGGSDFAIIDKNVDLDFAVGGIVWGAFNNSGQVCTSIENVLLPTAMRDDFLDKIRRCTDALQNEIDYGKIQNVKLLNKVSDYLKLVRDSDRFNLIIGGEITDGYLKPTIIECKDISSASYEVFSNILRIFYYDDESHIPQLINSTCYGLGCSIWTSEPESPRIASIVDDLHVGMIWVNDVNISFPELPWTGVKDSGVGFNLSIDSIREFSSIKTVSIDTCTNRKKEWWFPYEGDNR